MSRVEIGLAVIVAVLLAFWLGVLRGTAVGGQRERDAAEVREQRIDGEHLRASAIAERRHRDTEAALRTDLVAMADHHRKALHDEKLARDRFFAGVRSGAVRLSVPVASIISGGRPACAADAGRGSAAAAGDRHEARAELAPAAAEALAAIADDGDDAIRQLNACVDAYGAVRSRLNAERERGLDAQAE